MDLQLKYASIFEELNVIEIPEIIQLFLEELEEHENTRIKLLTSDRNIKLLEE